MDNDNQICEKCSLPDAIPCFLITSKNNEPDEYLCSSCAEKEGYCSLCGWFSAGLDGFDFLHPGLCNNCHEQIYDDYYDPEMDFSFLGI